MSIAQPFLTPFLESVGNAGLAGVLALRRSGLQLRVSAGLQPYIAVTGFAIMPSHPGERAPCLHTVFSLTSSL